jgi:hypothetical protein
MKITHQMICKDNKAHIDRLFEPRTEGAVAVKKPPRKQKATCFRNSKRQAVSSVGTDILDAFEAETGVTLSCGQCKNWVFGLNRRSVHDHDEIVQYMSREFPWPHEWRQLYPRRRDRISALIAAIVPPIVKEEIASNHFAGRLTAITSVNPNPLRWDRQKLCLDSWVAHGIPVIVVNTQAELDTLRLPPGIRSIAREGLTTLYDRETQYVSTLIEEGMNTNATFMLINSDIEIAGPVSLLDNAIKAADRLTIGIRHNHIAKAPRRRAARELSGLDVFLMTPELADTIPNAPFGIGKPVWDYWLPTHFMSIGRKFHWIKEPLFFHEKHPLGWTQSEWLCGRDFLDRTYGVELGYGCSRFRDSLDAWK